MLPLLPAQGIDPVVAYLYRREKGVAQQVDRDGFETRHLDARSTARRAAAVRRLLREERPDLVHTVIFESNLAGRLGAVRTGIPVLTSLVNILYSGGRLRDPNVRRSRLLLARAVDGWTARHLTLHFHAITHAVKRAAVQTLRIPEARITVIERGRDPARLGTPNVDRRRRARTSLRLDPAAPVLVNVGRQEHQKGHRGLLHGMARLMGERPDAVLLVAGRPGHATPELEREHARLGLGDRVRFLGHREDLPEVLAAADVFVFPSLWEGLGGALIEAMALGLPIVACDLEAIREVVEEGRNAVLVPPGDPEALARAIADLLGDGERARAFGRRSRAMFEQRFTLETSTGRMVDLYRRLARPSPSRFDAPP
jgi:glycosyltransferase involved in cell wall biosynthesis